jgi:hypothetical protein
VGRGIRDRRRAAILPFKRATGGRDPSFTAQRFGRDGEGSGLPIVSASFMI